MTAATLREMFPALAAAVDEIRQAFAPELPDPGVNFESTPSTMWRLPDPLDDAIDAARYDVKREVEEWFSDVSLDDMFAVKGWWTPNPAAEPMAAWERGLLADGPKSLRGRYGEAPTDIGPVELRWDEFMHYLYLPVRIPAHDLRTLPAHVRRAEGPWFRLPDRLWFLRDVVRTVLHDAREVAPHLDDPYVYITARRGYATPGNPLNRPGWHCDDFGGTDLNYVWYDAYPTRFLCGTTALQHAISADDETSMRDMARAAEQAERGDMFGPAIAVWPAAHLLRLTPWVIHDTPVIPAPGGMRSFLKVSVSSHRYDLLGNSHNHALDYEWPMVGRAELRNQPNGNRDYSGATR